MFFDFTTCEGNGIVTHWITFFLQMASHARFTVLHSSEQQKRENWTEWCVRWSIGKE